MSLIKRELPAKLKKIPTHQYCNGFRQTLILNKLKQSYLLYATKIPVSFDFKIELWLN
jgi:hypothetical protein